MNYDSNSEAPLPDIQASSEANQTRIQELKQVAKVLLETTRTNDTTNRDTQTTSTSQTEE